MQEFWSFQSNIVIYVSCYVNHIIPLASHREIATDNFDALYAVLKPKGVTVSAMLAKAVAEVLKKHPIVNAAYVEGGIKYNKGILHTACSLAAKAFQIILELFYVSIVDCVMM